MTNELTQQDHTFAENEKVSALLTQLSWTYPFQENK